MPPDPDRPNASRPEASPKLVLGAGWGFPVVRDPERLLAVAAEDESVRQSILIILRTVKGERVMRPDFGCDLHELVFAVNDRSTRAAAAYEVREALKRWEPRIELMTVEADAAGPRGEVLLVSVEYRVRSTDNRFNLVYPFYLDRPLA
ncbi:MAG TPA: GPW/gp25 family protein [Rubrivivax sp.]|nr:GPW/gp25 family protein [Rubrivivax sp.]HRY86455.1 GPW/gp25 family protein [Rubrivivax sp.]